MEHKGRYAPSPSGRMHLGNVFTALLSYLSAKSKGGKWLLRIEDLDTSRCRYEYSRQMEEDLQRLGLEWDEGGMDAAGGIYCQSRRSDIYAASAARLASLGLTYPCYCSRADILSASAPHESDGRVVYAGTCRPRPGQKPLSARQPDRPHSTRIIVDDRTIAWTDGHYGPQSVNLATGCGDFIIRRSDGIFAYQLAVVVDDALMGVSEVVRGRDLLLSTAQQIYLYDKLGHTPPPSFFHTPLLRSRSGERLSKRDNSMDLGEILRTLPPEGVIGRLACLAGLIKREEPCRPTDLIGLFDPARVPLEDIAVD